MGWFDVFTAVTFAGSPGLIGWGYTVTAPPHSEYGHARISFWLSAILLWSWAVVWAHRTHYVLPLRMGIAAAIAAIAGALLVYFLDIVDKREVAANAYVIKPTTPQYAYLMQVSEFLGTDEMGLRERFDFSNILNRNIDVQIIRMNYRVSGHPNDFFYNNYTDQGQMIFWAKEGKYKVTPQGVGLINVNDDDVLILVVTSKYNDAQKALSALMDSPFASDKLKHALADLRAQIGRNTEEMLHILDTRLHEDKRYFTEANFSGSPFAGVIVNDFARNAFPLKPAASAAVSEVSAELRGVRT